VNQFEQTSFRVEDAQVEWWQYGSGFDDWQGDYGCDSVEVFYHAGHGGTDASTGDYGAPPGSAWASQTSLDAAQMSTGDQRLRYLFLAHPGHSRTTQPQIRDTRRYTIREARNESRINGMVTMFPDEREPPADSPPGDNLREPPSIPPGPVGPIPPDLPGPELPGGIGDDLSGELAAERKQLAWEEWRLSQHPGPIEDQQLEERIELRRKHIADLERQLGLD
jgi:hypothetical protein